MLFKFTLMHLRSYPQVMFVDAPSGSGNVPLADWDLLGNGSSSSSLGYLASYIDGTSAAAEWNYGSPVQSAADLNAYVVASQQWVANHLTDITGRNCFSGNQRVSLLAMCFPGFPH